MHKVVRYEIVSLFAVVFLLINIFVLCLYIPILERAFVFATQAVD